MFVKDIYSHGTEPQVSDQSDRVLAILEEVKETLEPFKKAMAEAQDKQDHIETLQQQSLANLLKAQGESGEAHHLLANHQQIIKSGKTARTQARVDRIVSGKPPGKPMLTDDVEGRRLQENAGEADAVVAQLQEVYNKYCDDLRKAEAVVAAAGAQRIQAYLDGIATQMLEHDAAIKGLHAKLMTMTPAVSNISAVVRMAKRLVVPEVIRPIAIVNQQFPRPLIRETPKDEDTSSRVSVIRDATAFTKPLTGEMK